MIAHIDEGDKIHDHQFFDNEIVKFFKQKGIDIITYEPEDMKEDDSSGIYTSAHIIQKPGNKLYPFKKQDD